MGKISLHTTSKHLDVDSIEGHYGYTVGFEFSTHDEGPAPLFTGLAGNACPARPGRGHGSDLGPGHTRPHLHSPYRHAAWSAVQTLRRPHDRLSIRESVTEPGPEVQLEIAGSGGHG